MIYVQEQRLSLAMNQWAHPGQDEIGSCPLHQGIALHASITSAAFRLQLGSALLHRSMEQGACADLYDLACSMTESDWQCVEQIDQLKTLAHAHLQRSLSQDQTRPACC